MKQWFPHYYSDFQCIGSACQDNCCIGWEIGIDAETLKFYRQVPGALGQKLAQNISTQTPAHFLLTQKNRCPFLTAQNLCQIHTELGESHLCTICAEHPRFHNWFGSEQETGLGLCCEEAARLILFSPTPLSLVCRQTNQPDDPHTVVDSALLDALRTVRQAAFTICNTSALSIPHRLALLISLAQDLQNWFSQAEEDSDLSPTEFCIQACFSLADFYSDTDCYPSLIQQLSGAIAPNPSPALLQDLLQFHCTLSANDSTWHARLNQISDALCHFQGWSIPKHLELPLQNIGSYFLYRYFLPAAVQGDILSGVLPSVIATLVIALLAQDTLASTGTLTPEQQVQNAKAYSKEVEYSPENLKRLNDAIWSADFLSPMALIACLL